MSNVNAIFGGAIWMAVSALLTLAALEPVTIAAPTASVELAQNCAADCGDTQG